jgi:uncharacterized OsmC-like protein
MGGADKAPQPVETLLAAFAGCTQATATFVGRRMQPQRILIDRLEFDLAAYRDERGALTLPIEEDPPTPAMLQRIDGTIRVFIKEARTRKKKSDDRDDGVGEAQEDARPAITDDQLRLLAHQTEIRCPVASMIAASGCEMDVRWVDGSRTTTATAP